MTFSRQRCLKGICTTYAGGAPYSLLNKKLEVQKFLVHTFPIKSDLKGVYEVTFCRQRCQKGTFTSYAGGAPFSL